MTDDDDETEIDAAVPTAVQRLREGRPPLYGGAARAPAARAEDSFDDDAATRVAPTASLVPAGLRGMSLEGDVPRGHYEPEPSFERTVRPHEEIARRGLSNAPPPIPSEAPTAPRRGDLRAPKVPDFDFGTDEPPTLQEDDDDDAGATAVEGRRAPPAASAPFDRHTEIASVRGALSKTEIRGAPAPRGLPSVVGTVLVVNLVLTVVGLAMLAYLHHRHMF